ncbi:class B sortase [Alkalihalobacillus pseudalcaliphilus]|uniref:class B sortase n=1 Tax=Alkalihalobacillus pseudalcaliphilus TaxID=79884 RepID=UPI00064DF73D|nr:class B sortase [Alkalihalobacillus pseudalcaliphilus]KMK78167.1 sortase [Alkalihalobacillus pseudalcaliphilus]
MKTQQIKKKRGSRIITIICLLIFIYSAYRLIEIGYDYYRNHQVLTDIQEVYSPIERQEQSEENQQQRSSFNPLLDINEDIVAWITVEGTKIDYPILQSTDNDYYLNRNYLHQETRAGSIFMDFRNDITLEEEHTIVYGHRMKDGSMFAGLNQYLEPEFYQEHPSFSFDTLYQSYEVEIFAAYVTTTDFYYIETDFQEEQQFDVLLQEMKKRSAITTDVEVGSKDRIITLSTCDYQLDRELGRLVVHGKLTSRN